MSNDHRSIPPPPALELASYGATLLLRCCAIAALLHNSGILDQNDELNLSSLRAVFQAPCHTALCPARLFHFLNCYTKQPPKLKKLKI